MGAPVGNKNATKNKPWADALNRAIVQSDGAKLRAIADRLIEKAAEGDIQAIKELGDRLDGKAIQTTDMNVRGSLTAVLSGLGRDSGSPQDNP